MTDMMNVNKVAKFYFRNFIEKNSYRQHIFIVPSFLVYYKAAHDPLSLLMPQATLLYIVIDVWLVRAEATLEALKPQEARTSRSLQQNFSQQIGCLTIMTSFP